MSSGWRSNHSSTRFVVSSAPVRAASSIPMHHRLKVHMGVSTPEACQHILCHCLHQGAALCLKLATNDFLQLQHLGSCKVKKWEHGTDVLHRIPDVEGNEAEGNQCSLGLAQQVPDFLCLTCSGYLELLQPAVSGS
jgi:hypothetical protein